MVVGYVLGCVWDVQQLQQTSNGQGEAYIYATKSCSCCSNGQQKICVSSDEPMPLAGIASVLPVTLRPEVAVELLTHCLRHHQFNQ